MIVIPAMLPFAETYTVSVTSRDIKFRAGQDEIAAMDYPGGEIFERLAHQTQVGLVEHFPTDADHLPAYITNLAYIEVRRAAA